jgi:hypothetical protein
MNQIQLLKERQTIENAIELLENTVGVSIKWTQADAHDNGVDGFLVLYNQTFPIEEKRTFSIRQLPNILQKKKQHPNLIFITDVLQENIKTLLRENKINYLDTIGNAFIQQKMGLILLNGKKRIIKAALNKDKAFTKKGIVVVFHLLNDETLINTTYRNISAVTGASLDTITKVIQSLKAQKFIIQVDEKNIRLINKKRLFEKWADAYENRLKPQLFVGRFRFLSLDDELNWRNLQLTDKAVWGGEPAADILTNFLRPGIYTLYSTETRGEIMRNYRFAPDPNGNIYVYLPFLTHDNSKTIYPLLVYADMLNSGSGRNFEVAERIYEQYVKENFRY